MTLRQGDTAPGAKAPRLLSTLLCTRDEGPQLAISVLGTRNTLVFRRYSAFERPPEVEAFPGAISCERATNSRRASGGVVPSLRFKQPRTMFQHGRVFTRSPELPNPYTIQFSRLFRTYRADSCNPCS